MDGSYSPDGWKVAAAIQLMWRASHTALSKSRRPLGLLRLYQE